MNEIHVQESAQELAVRFGRFRRAFVSAKRSLSATLRGTFYSEDDTGRGHVVRSGGLALRVNTEGATGSSALTLKRGSDRISIEVDGDGTCHVDPQRDTTTIVTYGGTGEVNIRY